ncbi:hypothetical protein N2152v2_005242 [Parachlorella kessleri]
MASPILVGIAIFEAISWLVLLSGVASLQAFCDDNDGIKCGVIYAFGWWITSFQFFVLVWAGFAACAPAKGLRKATVPLLVSVTAIMMVSSNDTYQELEGISVTSHRGENFKNRLRCYFAGLIMSMVFNFLWIILAGFDDESGDETPKNMSSTAPAPAAPAPGYGAGPMYVQSPPPTVVVDHSGPASH